MTNDSLSTELAEIPDAELIYLLAEANASTLPFEESDFGKLALRTNGEAWLRIERTRTKAQQLKTGMIVTALLLIALMLGLSTLGWPHFPLILTVCSSLIGILAIGVGKVFQAPTFQSAYRHLAAIPSVHGATIALDAILQKPKDRREAAQILNEIIPHLSPEERRAFMLQDGERLKMLLNHSLALNARDGFHGDALPAVFVLIAEEGDESFIRLLFYHARIEASTEKEKYLRTAAMACYDRLMERVDFGDVQNIGKYFQFLAVPGTPPLSINGIDDQCALIKLLPLVTPQIAKELAQKKRVSHDQWIGLYQTAAIPTFEHIPLDWIGQFEWNISVQPVALNLAIIDLAGRLRDTRALLYVRDASNSATNRQIQTKAREVIAILEEQAMRDKTSKVLLRAAEAPAEELLRPVHETPHDETEREMLRPIE